ncbi:MAG TPA: Sir2 family NAD-dependent protein deacetylase [Ilumatobacteraceae bacterium]|nr:Sir2 family NAD-dependent protein deacetylase [Ilumatobacteraceae bacterium]
MIDIDRARQIVDAAERIVVLTGAGISTDSGIPDFRGPNGVWTRNPAAEKAATLSHYLDDPRVRILAWRNRIDHRMWSADPNQGHAAVTELRRQGRLVAVITQNVDGLHQAAGLDDIDVIEVHGTSRFTICWQCHDRRPMDEILERVRLGEQDPPCERCGGILKSDTISFGQSLVPEVIDRAFEVAGRCDTLIAVGSTLQVYPVAGVVPHAANHGAKIVIVNAEPTGMDDLADVIVRGSIGELLPDLVRRRRAGGPN